MVYLIIPLIKGETMTIDEAIAKAKAECKNEYAQTYLQSIPEAIEEYGENGFDIQLLYAYSNMTYWRGPIAKEVKAVFKTYLKKKGVMK